MTRLVSEAALVRRTPHALGQRDRARMSQPVGRRSPTPAPHRLDRLIAAIDAVVHDRGPLYWRLETLAGLVADAVAEPGLLPARHQASSPDGYRANLVHVAADGSFSVVALVWLPGQRTPIHSHRCWCVVAVHEGVELETRYELDESALRPIDHRVYRVGDVSWLAAERDIHVVQNIGDTRAVSLHVYGTDYRRFASSILDTYPPRAAGGRASLDPAAVRLDG